MNVSVIPVDSEVWGRAVLSLSEPEPADDLAGIEARYLREHQPAYVSVRLPMEDLPAIHRFERLGFDLVECQLRLLARFRTDFDVSRHGYAYTRVVAEPELQSVLGLAGSAIVHDRFSVDPAVPRGFSGRRYEAYVRQSFGRGDEEVWRLHDPSAGGTLGFRTHRRVSADEVLLLLGGIAPEFQGLGLGVVSSHYCFNQMRRDGVKRAVTHISAINRPVFDLEVAHFGFRLQRTFAILRKVYP